MPRLPPNAVPSYRKHKGSGQAVVTLGRDMYLGVYGSAESRREYDRLIAEWIVNGRRPVVPATDLSISELIASFWQHVQEYYRNPDGTATSEVAALRAALKPLRRLYGDTRAADFGPLKLATVRDAMIANGWTRGSVNKHTGRLKAVFKWAASRELLPASVHQSLTTLAGLRAGRSAARESVPVEPVSDATIDATLPHLPQTVQDMIRTQKYTGMRPGEVCIMQTGRIDRSGPVWVYRPAFHKNAFRGHHREVFIGPKAQAVLQPYLSIDPDKYIFVPAGKGMKLPTRKRKRGPGARYTTLSFNRAVARACRSAFPPPAPLARQRVPRGTKGKTRWEKLPEWRERLGPEQWGQLVEWTRKNSWHVHQLRHSAATQIRATHGIEAAGATLGHADLNVTAIYAQRSAELAKKVAAAVG